uniref:Uncharacterized protein n=1 Tax=Steinernema glaseri TaxID=37863 RepID=A0A1I8A981_9BILA
MMSTEEELIRLGGASDDDERFVKRKRLFLRDGPIAAEAMQSIDDGFFLWAVGTAVSSGELAETVQAGDSFVSTIYLVPQPLETCSSLQRTSAAVKSSPDLGKPDSYPRLCVLESKWSQKCLFAHSVNRRITDFTIYVNYFNYTACHKGPMQIGVKQSADKDCDFRRSSQDVVFLENFFRIFLKQPGGTRKSCSSTILAAHVLECTWCTEHLEFWMYTLHLFPSVNNLENNIILFLC